MAGCFTALRGPRGQSVKSLLQHTREQSALVSVPVQLWERLERDGVRGQYDVSFGSALV